jgi:hypothetical protein
MKFHHAEATQLFRARIAVYLAIALTSIGAAPIRCQTVTESQPSSTLQLLPAGATLVVRDSAHGKSYIATDKAIEVSPGQQRYVYGDSADIREADIPESILPSPDGRSVIVRTINHSYVLNSSNMRLMRRLEFSEACWERGNVAYLDDNGRIRLPRHKRGITLRGVDLISADDLGKNFLGMREIKRGTNQNGNVPTYRFFLCYRIGSHIRIRRRLVTMLNDPGSQGGAWHLAAIGLRTALFGIPEAAALVSDYVGVLRNGHVTGPIKEKHGHRLQFAQPPIIVWDSIVAIADAVNSDYKPIGRYLVVASKARLRVKKVGTDVAFVTYDTASKQVGVGVSNKGSVIIKWTSARAFLK